MKLSSTQNRRGTKFCDQVIKVKLTKISYIRTLFKVRCMQDFGLFRVWFTQVSLYKVLQWNCLVHWTCLGPTFVIKRDWCPLDTAWLKIFYFETLFKICFLQDSGLFKVRFRQVSLYRTYSQSIFQKDYIIVCVRSVIQLNCQNIVSTSFNRLLKNKNN